MNADLIEEILKKDDNIFELRTNVVRDILHTIRQGICNN